MLRRVVPRGRLFAILLILWFLLGGAPVRASAGSSGRVTIFAAASLSDVLSEILRGYRSGSDVVTAYAASSTLARQIERGAPADLFISADQAWMDYLEQAAAIDPSTRTVLAGNRLVLIGPSESKVAVRIEHGFPLLGLLARGRLAMGDPDHVPAGRYGKAALMHLGVWAQVANKIAPAQNVRAALNHVARGEAALGIVYFTDASAHSGVRILGRFPAASHQAIEYPAAVTRRARSPARARELLAHLRSDTVASILARYGYIVSR